MFWNLSLVADILGVNLFWWWVVFSEATHCVLSLWIESLIAKTYRVSVHLIDFLIRNASATSRTMELYYPSLLGWLLWMWHNSENGRCPEQEASLRRSNTWSFLEKAETTEAERIYKSKIEVHKLFFFAGMMERNSLLSFVSLFWHLGLSKSNKNRVGSPTDPINLGGREKPLHERNIFLYFSSRSCATQCLSSYLLLSIRTVNSNRRGAVCLSGLYSWFFSVTILIFEGSWINYSQKWIPAISSFNTSGRSHSQYFNLKVFQYFLL